MKLPNEYGSVVKLSGKRRNPYLVRKTNGWHFDKEKDKQVQDFIIIGYAPTRADGLQILADYNKNPFDMKAAKMTFDDVYEEWSRRKTSSIFFMLICLSSFRPTINWLFRIFGNQPNRRHFYSTGDATRSAVIVYPSWGHAPFFTSMQTTDNLSKNNRHNHTALTA